VRVGTPSFSRPGRATLGTGAWPSLHGVTTNRQRRALVIDSVFRRAANASKTCRVAGSPIWAALFGADIERCGASRSERTKEGPGTFDRVVPEVRASQEEAIAFVTAAPFDFRVVDLLSTDFAGHEFGGASTRYRDELGRADGWIRRIVESLDFDRDAVLVTADHGHIDLNGHGGHGGNEPEVLSVPLVMAGSGVTAGANGHAEQVDIAPTIARLLDVAAPAGAEGRVLVEALEVHQGPDAVTRDRDRRNAIATAARSSLGLGLGRRLDAGGSVQPSDWRSDLRREIVAARAVTAATASAVLVLLFWWTLARGADRRHAGAMILGLLGGGVALGASLRWFGPPLSLSAINYDENVPGYFGFVVLRIAASFLIGLTLTLFASDRATERAQVSVRFTFCAALSGALAFVALWSREPLLSVSALPSMDALEDAFAILLGLGAVSLVGLLAVAVAVAVAVATKSALRGPRAQGSASTAPTALTD
jgi:hypothetical protein